MEFGSAQIWANNVGNGVTVFFSPQPGIILYRNYPGRIVEDMVEARQAAVDQLIEQYAVSRNCLFGGEMYL